MKIMSDFTCGSCPYRPGSQIALFQCLAQLMHDQGVRCLSAARCAYDSDPPVIHRAFDKVAPETVSHEIIREH